MMIKTQGPRLPKKSWKKKNKWARGKLSAYSYLTDWQSKRLSGRKQKRKGHTDTSKIRV